MNGGWQNFMHMWGELKKFEIRQQSSFVSNDSCIDAK